MNKTFKTISITVISCIMFFIIVIGIWFVKLAIQPPPFLCELKTPESISLNDTAKVVFMIRNQDNKTKTLESIDIYKSFIDNFDIINKSDNIVSIHESINFVSFYIKKPLIKLQKEQVTLFLKPKSQGTFAGDFMVMTPEDDITHSAIGMIIK